MTADRKGELQAGSSCSSGQLYYAVDWKEARKGKSQELSWHQ